MLARILSAALAAAFLCSALAFASAEEMESYSFASGSKAYGGNGEDIRGFVDCQVVYRNDRPLIAYGAQKRLKEKGRFLYVILFSPDAPKSGIDVATDSSADGDAAKTSTKFTWNKCELHVQYQFVADPKTNKIVSESLHLNGKEVSADGPRLFLMDLSGEAAKMQPVKLALPAPPLKLQDARECLPELQLLIAQLKKDSPEVAKFLAGKR